MSSVCHLHTKSLTPTGLLWVPGMNVVIPEHNTRQDEYISSPHSFFVQSNAWEESKSITAGLLHPADVSSSGSTDLAGWCQLGNESPNKEQFSGWSLQCVPSGGQVCPWQQSSQSGTEPYLIPNFITGLWRGWCSPPLSTWMRKQTQLR